MKKTCYQTTNILDKKEKANQINLKITLIFHPIRTTRAEKTLLVHSFFHFFSKKIYL